jgi:general secretion pathway protein L
VALFFVMLRDFGAWWLRQMTGLLPDRLSRRSAMPATALILTPDSMDNADATAVSLSVRRRRREQDIDRFPLDEAGLAALRRTLLRRGRRWPVVLRLAPDLLMEREVDLPLAVEPEIGNTLRFSIDSLTPFASEELYWSWAILLRDRVHGRLHVRLSLVRKAAVEPLIAALRRSGNGPKLLELPVSDNDTRVIAPGDLPARGSALGRYGPGGLCAFGLGALVAMAGWPVIAQLRDLEETEARIAALKPSVAQATALRRAAAGAEGADVIANERKRVGDALALLAVITDALPDDTYLTEFSLHQRKLALSGESGAAAKVIVALSAEPALRKPEFAAPVTRAPVGARDTFSVKAEVEP